MMSQLVQTPDNTIQRTALRAAADAERRTADRRPSRHGRDAWMVTSSAMGPRVDVETSVVSYLASRPGRDLVVAAHQQIAHGWWNLLGE